MSRVLLSPMLSPVENSRVCQLLKRFHPATQFTGDAGPDVALRVATASEITLPALASKPVFSVTPFCLSQMLEANLDPFSYRPKCSQSLVNIFLIGKVFAIASFSPDDKKRLMSLIVQMGGTIADMGSDVTYVISLRPVNCFATVVHPCWIDSLFTSRTFIEPREFLRQPAPPHQKPAPAPVLSQRPPPRRGSGGLVLVPDRAQTSIPFPRRSDSQPAQPKRPAPKRHREAVPGILSLDLFFSSTQASGAAQSQALPARTDAGSQITIHEIDREVSQPGLRRVAQPPAAAEEEVSDDGAPSRPRATPARLDALCQLLLRAGSRPPGLEPASGDTRSAISDLQLFSQAEEEPKPAVVFDVAYESATPPMHDASATDLFIDALTDC
jgi:hypothetical protein